MQKRLNLSRCRFGSGFGWALGTMYYMGVSYAPMERGNLEGEGHAPTCPTFWRERWKNGWTDHDTVWVMDSGGSKKACIRRNLDPAWERAIIREKDMPMHNRRHSAVSCAKMAEPIDLSLGLWTWVGRRKHKFNPIRQMAPMCPHGVTLAPPDEYDWTVRLRRRCDPMSNYFDHLLLFISISIIFQ